MGAIPILGQAIDAFIFLAVFGKIMIE